MISGILLAVLLAIIGFNIVRGPQGYRKLVEAGAASRTSFYRRMLTGQLLQFTLPPILGLLVLGRTDAVIDLPGELWAASALLTGGDVPVEPDPLMTWFFAGAILFAIPLGAALTWRRTRQGKGPPRLIDHIAALLPRNRSEVLFGGAISLAAGIGEELFFRLLLPMLLAAFIDGVAAVVVAILLFGLAHAYQGWKGVLITGAVGAALTAMYLMSGSLLVVMLFHVTIDLMSMVIRPVIRGAWAVPAD